MSARGRFVTLEGVDGAGKSTHVPALIAAIEARGHTVLATREPGGTPLGERLREILLHEPMSANDEVFLMFAARSQHVDSVIRPALLRGEWVLCDRFTDSTYAYQGGGHGVDPALIGQLAHYIHGDCNPDLTLLFDVPAEVSRSRLARLVATGRELDRFEREHAEFTARVRAVYLERAAAEPARVRVIDSTRALGVVDAELRALVAAL